MDQYTTPSSSPRGAEGSVADVLWRVASAEPDRPALASRKPGRPYQTVALSEVREEVEQVAKGLIGSGIEAGDRVALFSPTRIEYTYVDLALWAIGAVAVTIYETSSAAQVEWIIENSGAKAIFIDGGDRRRIFDERAGKPGTCDLVFDFDRLDDLKQAGAFVDDQHLMQRRARVDASDLATLVYTSGTTGQPKGVELTHFNLQWTLNNSLGAMGEIFHPGASTLMFLPLAHIFARMIQVAALETGTVVYYSTGLENLVDELQMSRPSFIFAAPRVFEKLYNRARQTAHEGGKGRLFDLAAEVAKTYSREMDAGRQTLRVRALHALFEPLVYRKIRGVLGGSARHALSGSAPLAEELGHFYRGIGVEVLEGYGLTESSAGGAVNLPGAVKIGTVGRPTPGSTIRINDDGEILMRGGHIMRGYWRGAVATSTAIDEDGWLHTGDIGVLDSDGFLRVTGRKKDIIVTASGKNVAPAPLEFRVRSHPLVGACVVIGDGRPFVSALVSIDPDEWKTWSAQHGLEGPVADNVDSPLLRREVGRAVEMANLSVSRAESIREFRILPEDFTVEGGELTTTLKVRKAVVEDKYRGLVDSIYGVSENDLSNAALD